MELGTYDYDLWSLGLMELGTYGRNSGSVLASPAVTIVSIQSWAVVHAASVSGHYSVFSFEFINDTSGLSSAKYTSDYTSAYE